MKIAGRLALGVATALVAVIVVQLAKGQVPPPLVCIDDESRVHVRAITLEAIDASFKDQVMHLFEVWMRDAKDQPGRAKVGIQNALQAYQRARHDALAWMPQQCS